MMQRGSPSRAKFLRGTILWMIYFSEDNPINPDDPTLMSREVLSMSLEELGMLPANEELHRNMRYLEQKRYITVDWATDGSGTFTTVRVTPLGMDLVEGSEVDKGVTFQQRRRK